MRASGQRASHQSDSPARQAGRGLRFAGYCVVAVNLVHLPDEPGGVIHFIPLDSYALVIIAGLPVLEAERCGLARLALPRGMVPAALFSSTALEIRQNSEIRKWFRANRLSSNRDPQWGIRTSHASALKRIYVWEDMVRRTKCAGGRPGLGRNSGQGRNPTAHVRPHVDDCSLTI